MTRIGVSFLICIVIIIINLIKGVQGGTYTKTVLPYGDSYSSISATVSGTNISVLGEDSTGYRNLYLSSDSGSTWRKTNANSNFNFAMCACQSSTNGQYIYVGVNNYNIFVSSNWGQSFSATTTPTTGTYYIATSSTGQYTVACASYYIIVSSSFGTFWNSTGLSCNSLTSYGSIAMSSNGSYVVAATEGYPVYVSSSYGIYWSTTSLTSSQSYIYTTCSSSGQYIYASSGFLEVSSNYGMTFNEVTENFFSVLQLVTSSSGQNLAAVIQTNSISNQTIWVSYNFGVNWILLDAPVIHYPYNSWTTLAMDSTGAFIFAGQDNGTVYILQQNLPTQSPTPFPTQSQTPTRFPTQSPTYINGNPTPIPTVSPTPVPIPPPYGLWYKSISSSASGTNISVVGVNMTTFSSSVYLSSSSGTTWSKSLSTPNLFAPWACQSSATGQYIYLGSGSSVYVSSTWGNSFSSTLTPNINSVACSTSSNGQYVVVVSDNIGGIIVSSSYGESWSTVANSGFWSSVAMSSSGQYIVAVQAMINGVYVSSSYGVNWSTTSSSGYSDVTCSSTGQYCYVSSSNLAVSSNYGYSWSVIPASDLGFSYLVTSSNGQNLAAFIQTSNSQSIWVSYNFAANWTILDAPAVDFQYNYWTWLAMDSTGAYIFASQYNGSVYTFHQTLPPTNSPTPSPTFSNGHPTPIPSKSPTLRPTKLPSVSPTPRPTPVPSWVKSNSPSSEWTSIAASNGQYMAASNGQDGAGIYISSDYGMNWNFTMGPNGIVTAGQNGKYVVSCGSGIYVSSNYGQSFKLSWSANTGCSGVAISSNGTYIIYSGSTANMTTFKYPLYISSNYGSTFTVSYGLVGFNQASILLSSSGQFVLVYSVFSFYISSNYGQSFSPIIDYPSDCNSMVCDSSCTIIIGVASNTIYVSSNMGQNFTQADAPYGYGWTAATLSSTGQYAAAIYGSTDYIYSIYVSFDYGNTWSQSSAPTETFNQWSSISMSSSGTYLAAGQISGYIYTDVQTQTPPTFKPTNAPTLMPSGPSYQPSLQPSQPSNQPTGYYYYAVYGGEACQVSNFEGQVGQITNRCISDSTLEDDDDDGNQGSYYNTCDEGNVYIYEYESNDCSGSPTVSKLATNTCIKIAATVGIQYFCESTASEPVILVDSLVTYEYGQTYCNSSILSYTAIPIGTCSVMDTGIIANCDYGIPSEQFYNDSICHSAVSNMTVVPTECINNSTKSSTMSCYVANSPTLSVNVQVNNVISGTTYAQYQSSVSAYTSTITQTIVNSTNKELRSLGSTGYLSESNIFYLTVQPTPSSAAASRRVLASSSSIQVTYSIQSSMASLSASSISSAVANTLTSGTYNSALHYYAQVNDVPELQNSSLTQTSVVDLATPTQQSSGGIKKPNVGAIVGGILGSLILLSILAAVYLHKKRLVTVSRVVDITSNVDSESRPSALAHRISIMSPNSSSTSTTLNPMISNDKL